jgi:uncharacterized DUF497 family protein
VSGGFPIGFEWDEEKNHANKRKHGIDFRDAVRIFEGPALDRVDKRADYGEVRINSLGDLNGLIIANITHTDRSGETRLISARLANRAERDLYLKFRRALRSHP